uniref:Uncharacterized protein n=1 Tax=Leersia perrieri TaxID=77586 RepID=A0A0D9UZY4_9ORYZ
MVNALVYTRGRVDDISRILVLSLSSRPPLLIATCRRPLPPPPLSLFARAPPLRPPLLAADPATTAEGNPERPDLAALGRRGAARPPPLRKRMREEGRSGGLPGAAGSSTAGPGRADPPAAAARRTWRRRHWEAVLILGTAAAGFLRHALLSTSSPSRGARSSSTAGRLETIWRRRFAGRAKLERRRINQRLRPNSTTFLAPIQVANPFSNAIVIAPNPTSVAAGADRPPQWRVATARYSTPSTATAPTSSSFPISRPHRIFFTNGIDIFVAEATPPAWFATSSSPSSHSLASSSYCIAPRVLGSREDISGRSTTAAGDLDQAVVAWCRGFDGCGTHAGKQNVNHALPFSRPCMNTPKLLSFAPGQQVTPNTDNSQIGWKDGRLPEAISALEKSAGAAGMREWVWEEECDVAAHQ